jgi:hypothetical protein
LLAVFAEVADVPLELIAEIGAAEGHVTAVDILHHTAPQTAAADHTSKERTRDAMLLAGAAAAENSRCRPMSWRSHRRTCWSR